MSDRPCSCHPSEAPQPCQKRYALDECQLFATIDKINRANMKRRTETREASPCPHYGTQCEYVPLAHKVEQQAARIEQLEAEAKTRTLDYLGQAGQLSDEITRLRAALREIASRCDIHGERAADRGGQWAADTARAALEGK